MVKSRSGSRASSTNRDRIKCFECREYDHFARECLSRQMSREIWKIQQMLIWMKTNNITTSTDGHR